MSCHRCSAEMKVAGKSASCAECGCRCARAQVPLRLGCAARLEPHRRCARRFHTYDCGNRMATHMLDLDSCKQCPRVRRESHGTARLHVANVPRTATRSRAAPQCKKLCYCAGGPVPCHTGKSKRKREQATAAIAAASRAGLVLGAHAYGAAPAQAMPGLPPNMLPRDAVVAALTGALRGAEARGAQGAAGGLGGAGGGAAGGDFPPLATMSRTLHSAIFNSAVTALMSATPSALRSVCAAPVAQAVNEAAAQFATAITQVVQSPQTWQQPPPLTYTPAVAATPPPMHAAAPHQQPSLGQLATLLNTLAQHAPPQPPMRQAQQPQRAPPPPPPPPPPAEPVAPPALDAAAAPAHAPAVPPQPQISPAMLAAWAGLAPPQPPAAPPPPQ